jgi:hypothetical protein
VSRFLVATGVEPEAGAIAPMYAAGPSIAATIAAAIAFAAMLAAIGSA